MKKKEQSKRYLHIRGIAAECVTWNSWGERRREWGKERDKRRTRGKALKEVIEEEIRRERCSLGRKKCLQASGGGARED